LRGSPCPLQKFRAKIFGLALSQREEIGKSYLLFFRFPAFGRRALDLASLMSFLTLEALLLLLGLRPSLEEPDFRAALLFFFLVRLVTLAPRKKESWHLDSVKKCLKQRPMSS